MFKFGFYNSLNNDRRYNAEDFAHIFDGIITEGVLKNVGERFMVRSDGGIGILIDTGRAWLDRTWNWNDAPMHLTISSANNLGDRIDAVIIEVDRRDENRFNSIRILEGTPATANPVRPTLIRSRYVNQYPLAFISVPRGITELTQGHITNMVGTSDMPFVTAPLERMNTDQLLAEWRSQWLTMFTQQNTDWNNQMNVLNEQYLELLNTIHLIETGLFLSINNNFDDWSVRRGCQHNVIFEGSNIIETLTFVTTNFMIAQKLNIFVNGGSIFEIVVFRPFEVPPDVLSPQENKVITTGSTMARETVFNANGSITMNITGETFTITSHLSHLRPWTG